MMRGKPMQRPSHTKRWSSSEKTAYVLRMLQGEEPDTICREAGVSEDRLMRWKEDFLEGGRHLLENDNAQPQDAPLNGMQGFQGTPSDGEEAAGDELALPHEPKRLEPRLQFGREIAPVTEPWRVNRKQLAKQRIIHPQMKDTRVLNEFRNIRTALIQQSAGQSFNVMVTPVCPQGGGSFVARNLAVALSFDETKTSLLIDCDLPHPDNTFMRHDEVTGLTDFLDNPEIGIDRVTHDTGVPRMRVVPVGGCQQMTPDHLGSPRMQRFIFDLSMRYPDRYAVLDAPAINSYADARILADLCDFVVLVAPYGKVTSTEVMNAAKLIGYEKLAGVVFNNEPS